MEVLTVQNVLQSDQDASSHALMIDLRTQLQSTLVDGNTLGDGYTRERELIGGRSGLLVRKPRRLSGFPYFRT